MGSEMCIRDRAYSSLTSESRIASFAWFATWAACWIAHSSLTTAELTSPNQEVDQSGRTQLVESWAASRFGDEKDLILKKNRPPRSRQWFEKAAGLDTSIDHWAWISPYHSLGVIQGWIFGIEKRAQAIVPPAIALSVITCLSLCILWRRVDAPVRA